MVFCTYHINWKPAIGYLSWTKLLRYVHVQTNGCCWPESIIILPRLKNVLAKKIKKYGDCGLLTGEKINTPIE